MVTVFTDGSALKNGKKGALTGIGVYCPEKKIELSMNIEEVKQKLHLDFHIQNTNNTGELLAILLALEDLHEEDPQLKTMTIYSDSNYCINCVVLWHKKWSTNGWKTANGSPVKNREIIERILLAKELYKSVFFIHVKSHTKEPQDKTSFDYVLWYGNNKADTLATDASKKLSIGL